MEEVQGVVEIAMEEVQGMVEVAAMEEVQGVVEVAAMEEVQGVVEVHAVKEMVQEQEMVRKTYSNPTSTCEVCIHPSLCLKCGIRGEASIFLCPGSCGNPCICDNYWCKDCAITAAINKDGICIRCRRNPSIYLEEEKKVHDVPDSQV
ncbi:hypothetical protein ZWY2020_021210 [Hordeum vulgare]|nr:hypothetical protein ZWY2020_021210 [Hordeum vulgare]